MPFLFIKKIKMKGEELKKLIKSYMDDCAIEGNSKASMENKEGAFRRFLEFLGYREFNPDEVKRYTRYLMDRGLQPSSIATDIRKYKAFANWLAAPERNLAPIHWPKLIKVPLVPNKEIDVPSAELTEKIIIAGTDLENGSVHRNINNEGRDCMLLMLRTGLRVNEALHLEKQDLFLENQGHEWFRVASKGKHGEKDKLPLMASAAEILNRPRTLRRKGCHKNQFFGVSEHALNSMLERGCEKLVIPKITSHKLRHVFGTEMARGGIPSYHLQKLMRHSELETTLRYYVHLELEDFRKSLEMYHPLALRERTPEQTFRQLKEAVDQLRIRTDQFKVTIIEGQSLAVEKLPPI